jgi:hypothetical protein
VLANTHATGATQEVLPLAPGGGVGGDAAPGVRRLRLGERVALDELGPVIVQPDCTLRRIENWAALTPHEQQAAHRRLGARNGERLAACRELEAQGRLPQARQTASEGAEADGAGAGAGADADAALLAEPDLDALLDGSSEDGAHDEL